MYKGATDEVVCGLLVPEYVPKHVFTLQESILGFEWNGMREETAGKVKNSRKHLFCRGEYLKKQCYVSFSDH